MLQIGSQERVWTMSNNAPPPITRFMRLKSILAPVGPIPVGKSTWWAGVKSGRFPKPHKLGPRITAWTDEDIRTLCDVLAGRCPDPSDTGGGV
jgi:prophage regulatory protein